MRNGIDSLKLTNKTRKTRWPSKNSFKNNHSKIKRKPKKCRPRVGNARYVSHKLTKIILEFSNAVIYFIPSASPHISRLKYRPTSYK